jgi:DNA-binding transcriptional MerR regulator
MMTMTTLDHNVEIDLADNFADKSYAAVTANNLSIDEMSLPAALCDEQLLAEINSIPSKMGFKIGEVAEMLEIKQYVLRYWESEFEVLKPKKASNNQRYYTRKDVENAFIIRKLLHRDRFSIEGARSALKGVKSFVKKEKDWSSFNLKIEAAQERLTDLIIDIRRMRTLF